MSHTAVVLLAVTLLVPPAVEAQDSVAVREPPHMCFRGRPLPRCSGFWLTEFGVGARVRSNVPDASGPLFTWELGLMSNRTQHSAFGAALFAEGADEGAALGLRPRYRRWLTPRTTLDLSPGIILSYSGYQTPAFSGHVALNFSDYFAFTSTVQVARRQVYVPQAFDPGGFPTSFAPMWQTHSTWFAGGRLGALPGTIVGIAVPTGVVILFLIVCGGGGCFD